MTTSPELVSYIAQELGQGTAAEQLRESLMGAGWSEIEIANALHDVAAGMEPLTVGASIHEDLAQVRAVVAHLASRMQRLEAKLATGGVMPLHAALPSAETLKLPQLEALPPPPPSSLPVESHHASAVRAAPAAARGGRVSTTGAIAVFLTIAATAWYVQSSGAPSWLLGVLVLVGMVLVGASYQLARMGHGAPAQGALVAGIAVWGMCVYYSWLIQQALEGSVAIGLGVFLLVCLGVMGQWIRRFTR